MQHRCTYTCSHIWSNACRQHTHTNALLYVCASETLWNKQLYLWQHNKTSFVHMEAFSHLTSISSQQCFTFCIKCRMNPFKVGFASDTTLLNPMDVRNDNLGITHPTKYFVSFFSYCWPLTLSLLRRLLSYYTTLCKIILSYLASISVECFSSSWCTQVPTCFLLLGKNMKTRCLKLPVTCGTLDRNFCIIDFFFHYNNYLIRCLKIWKVKENVGTQNCANLPELVFEIYFIICIQTCNRNAFINAHSFIFCRLNECLYYYVALI